MANSVDRGILTPYAFTSVKQDCSLGLIETLQLNYVPYTTIHVITRLELLLFFSPAFAVLKRTGIYADELQSANLDSDWFYRRLPEWIWTSVGVPLAAGIGSVRGAVKKRISNITIGSPKALVISQMVLLIVFLLLFFLGMDFWQYWQSE